MTLFLSVVRLPLLLLVVLVCLCFLAAGNASAFGGRFFGKRIVAGSCAKSFAGGSCGKSGGFFAGRSVRVSGCAGGACGSAVAAPAVAAPVACDSCVGVPVPAGCGPYGCPAPLAQGFVNPVPDAVILNSCPGGRCPAPMPAGQVIAVGPGGVLDGSKPVTIKLVPLK